MMTSILPVRLLDLHPQLGDLSAEVLDGLRKPQKELPPKLFYDARGSKLFDEITELDEYYPTRTETAIMRGHIGAMAAYVGPDCLLIEYGSGSSTKTRTLLDHLAWPAAYVPIDISRDHLLAAANDLATAYPDLEVLPVCADYTADFALPVPSRPAARRVAYFPGSTIGNFHPPEAHDFLARIAKTVGPGGGLLIGVDLHKGKDVLEPAYNDRRGVTAAFNLNVLVRLNRELDADFDLAAFRHCAYYNERERRIEMHLISGQAQQVRVAGEVITFAAGESILTECSYKYGLADFARLAESAGWQVEGVWTDRRELFSVQYLRVGEERLR